MNASSNIYDFEPLEPQKKENIYDFQQIDDQNTDDQSKEESTYNKVLQPIASLGAHAVGAIAAIPGNVRDLAYMAGDEARRMRSYLSDKLGLSFDDKFLENDSIKNFDESIKAPFRFIANKIPNSQDVNKYIDEVAGGYLAPKSEWQKTANGLAEDIVNSALHRNPKNLIQNFLIPLGANVIKKGAELFGVDPSSSEVLKMLSWIGADMAYIADPKQMLQNRLAQTRRLASPSDMIPVTPRDSNFLNLLEKDMSSGGTRPSTQAALTKINEMRNAMSTGQISARQSLDFYRSINELLTNFGAFNVEGASRAQHVYRLNQVQELNRNMLNRYGKNQNPRFLESFRETNLGWAALQQSDNVAAFVKKNYTKPFVSEAAKAMFVNSGGKGLAFAGGLTALERLQSFVRRLQNPVLRKYYGDVLGYSLKNNKTAMVDSLNKFDKAAKQFEDNELQ